MSNIEYGLSLSIIDSIFHSSHGYKFLENFSSTTTKVEELLKKKCSVDAGKGLQKHNYNCEHYETSTGVPIDSYSFSLIKKNRVEMVMYNACDNCGKEILKEIKANFKLKLTIKKDNLIPNLQLNYSKLGTAQMTNDYLFWLILIPSKSIILYPQVYRFLLDAMQTIDLEGDHFLTYLENAFQGILTAMSQVQFKIANPEAYLKMVEEIGDLWKPLIDFYIEGGWHHHVMKLNKYVSQRFFLAYVTQVQDKYFKVRGMTSAVKLNSQILETAQKTKDAKTLEKVIFDAPVECLMASSYLVEASLFNQLLDYCENTWIPLASKIEDYESKSRACFAFSEAAGRVSYNPYIISKSLEYVEDGLELAKKHKLTDNIFMGLMKKAELYGFQNDPKAFEYRKEALSYAKKTKNEKHILQAMYNFAIDYQRQNRLEESLEQILAFQEKVKKSPSPEFLQFYAQSLQMQSDIYLKLGYPQKSAETTTELVKLLKQQGRNLSLREEDLTYFENYTKKMSSGLTTDELKDSFNDINDQLQTNLNFLEQSVLPQLAISGPESLEYASSLMNAARTRVMLDDLKQANKELEKAKKIHQTNNNYMGEIDCLSAQARILLKRKKTKKGSKYLDDVLNKKEQHNINDLSYVMDLTLMGYILRSDKKFYDALEHFEKACKTGISLAENRGLETTRTLYSGVIGNTIDLYCETTLMLAKKRSKDFSSLLLSCLELVETYRNREIINKFNVEPEIEGCPQTKQLFEKENEIVSKLAEIDYYLELMKEKVESGEWSKEEANKDRSRLIQRKDELNNKIERIRGNIYLECLNVNQFPKPLSVNLLEQINTILQKDDSRAIIDFILIPKIKSQMQMDILVGFDAKNLEKMSEFLEEDSKQYSEANQFTVLAYLIDKEEVVIDHLDIDSDKLVTLCDNLVGAIDKGESKSLARLTSKMYGQVIPKKIQSKLNSSKYDSLTIIPDKLLHTIPWEIIGDSTGKLGLQYNLSKSFGLNLFRTCFHQKSLKAEKGTDGKVILLGNPTGDLPGSEQEVKKIAELLKKKKIPFKLLLKDQVKHQPVLKQFGKAYPIIHFAGHGNYLKANPQLSFLYLNDYNLTAHEIGSLKSPAMMAILSACETGVTRLIDGAEILGLIRSLQLASIPTVIATNWRVFDESAAYFIEQFYRFYLNKEPVGKSLQNARKKTAEKYPDLVHWGAYTLYE